MESRNDTSGLNPDSERPHLPVNFSFTHPVPSLQYHGAEALIYKTHFLSPTVPAALKYRPSKPYRHPILDTKLTKHRILAEARVLVRLRKEGVSVPAVYSLDWNAAVPSSTQKGKVSNDSQRPGGWILMQWIEGVTIRKVLDKDLGGYLDRIESLSEEEKSKKHAEPLWKLMSRIGRLVGRMHDLAVVHGDLTTSNLMLNSNGTGDTTNGNHYMDKEVTIIDFGLASQAVQEEDRAVDLYVLERAFGSTHRGTEDLFGELLRAYGKSSKAATTTLKRLEEVRMRGRKKITIG